MTSILKAMAASRENNDEEKGTTSSEKSENEPINDSFEKETAVDGEGGQPISTTHSNTIRQVLSRQKTSASSKKSKKASQMVKEVYPETDLDSGLVGWDGQDDPAHPRNFPEQRKWLLLGFVSAITFLTPLTSSIPAPGISIMNKEFHNESQVLNTFVVSIFILGFSFGPLVFSPLSEIYGRTPVLNFCNVFLVVWQIGCALAPNIGSLIVMRFLAGLGGSGCLAIGGGVIADLFPVQQRGTANSMFVLGPLFGPVVGPLVGGFIAQRAGWRWVYWVILIAGSLFTIGFFLASKETNHAVLIRAKTARLRKETGRSDLVSVYDASKSPQELKLSTVLATGVARPFRMVFLSPILPILAIYISFLFSLVFLIFTTVTGVYIKQYGWQPEMCGLAFLGVGLGFVLGVVATAQTSDPTVIRLTAANGGVYEPEMRLAPCVFFGLFVPISFFWYGWSAEKQVHWIVPIIGLLPFGVGTMGVMACIQTYFIDVAGIYAASSVAGLTAIRCLFAAFLPLAAPKMYEDLGLGWGNSLLGFIALALIPAPLLIYKSGAKIRKRYPIRIG